MQSMMIHKRKDQNKVGYLSKLERNQQRIAICNCSFAFQTSSYVVFK